MKWPIAIVLLPVLLNCATPIQLELDAEVKRLCAVDGGVRIYETVRLPASRFNESGHINFFVPHLGEDALGPEYRYQWTTRYVIGGEDQGVALWRSEHRIVRRQDGKILGESVRYSRRGGDPRGPWHPSAFSCPPISPENPSLLSAVFVRGE
jgi:hypothetical protein